MAKSKRQQKGGKASNPPPRRGRYTAPRKCKRGLPKRIAEVRGNRSQRSFALDLGTSQRNINRYENGATPHADFLIIVALKENISIDWLLLGRGRMRKSA